MEETTHDRAVRESTRALRELEEGNVLTALACLERSLAEEDNPELYACFGYCVAKERGHVTRGLELCRAAIEHEPDNPMHDYYLAKVQLLAGDKQETLATLRRAMNKGGAPEVLLRMLAELGTRKPPPIRFLKRDNPLNKYLGILLSRLGLR